MKLPLAALLLLLPAVDALAGAPLPGPRPEIESRPSSPPHLPPLPPLPKKDAARPLVDIRVTVVGDGQDDDVTRALQQLGALGFSVTLIPPHAVEKLDGVDVLYLPTGWYENRKQAELLDEMRSALTRFFKKGGGLVAGQPNPYGHPEEQCTPRLLPYPIRFHNWYVTSDAQRRNLDPSHFITDDVPAEALPYPADRMLEVDSRYHALARGDGSQSSSLVVADIEKGRVVVHTSSDGALHDELLRRMVIWAARAEPARREERQP